VEAVEKDQVEEAAKTKHTAEYTLTAITYDPILNTKTPTSLQRRLTRRTK
jgi:hypothetical protein